MMNHSTKKIRTRFAPSPTGYLHIGGARTALFAWLFARQQQGTFILRIEDTDLERSTPESIKAIYEAMAWLDLDYDEGPFLQTDRFPRYREVMQQLLASGHAYRCQCSKERLEQLRAAQTAAKQKPRYDGHCRHLALPAVDGQPSVLRFANPEEGDVSFDDRVRGLITVANRELDDLIIARSDGSPTYNFTVVVDDWDMQITDVIRGDDHINNTPRQINILKALGADIPRYGHVPMILGADGQRLSKRHGAVSVLEYRDQGYLPQALLNYLVRLGWSHQDQEIFSRDEMIRYFNVRTIQRSPAAFNPEKLLWLNHHYLKTLDPSQLTHELAAQFDQLSVDYRQGPSLAAVMSAQAERYKTLKEIAEHSQYFYTATVEYQQPAAQQHLTAAALPVFEQLLERFSALTEWRQELLHTLITEAAAERSLKLGQVAQPLRVALTGNTISPPIDMTLCLFGQSMVIQRLQAAIRYIVAVA